jgi:hypothetical protein
MEPTVADSRQQAGIQRLPQYLSSAFARRRILPASRVLAGSAITLFSEKNIKTLLEPRRSPPLAKLAAITANHAGGYGAQAGSSNTRPTTSTATPSQPVRRPVA